MKKITTVTVAAFAVALVLVPAVMAQKARGEENAAAVRSMARQEAEKEVETGQQKAAKIKNEAASKSLKVRQEVCEQKREKLQNGTRTMYRGAESVKMSLDTMYTRVAEFYESGKLTTPNYAALVDKIELAKKDAETSMEALSSRAPDAVDCTDMKTATRLEGDKLAGEGAKTALKNYRKALVDLISALKSANASENKTTTKPEGTTNE